MGDSADIEIDRGFGRNQAFISRSFSKGKVSRINLTTFAEDLFETYSASDPAPAPGLDLDLAATGGGRGYLAAPELAGVREFNLANPDPVTNPPVDIPADVYYHLRNGIATGCRKFRWRTSTTRTLLAGGL